MPVYHSVLGRTITVYLEVEADPQEPPEADPEDESEDDSDDESEDDSDDESEDDSDDESEDDSDDESEDDSDDADDDADSDADDADSDSDDSDDDSTDDSNESSGDPDNSPGSSSNDPMSGPFAALLAQIAVEWTIIANKRNLKLVFVPSENTIPPNQPPPGTVHLDDAQPTDRILYMTTPPASLPGTATFFKIRVGFGQHAETWSKSTKTSYVTYLTGQGYIYVLDSKVPDISHELGHILGLTDRYFEAMYWDKKQVIKRTCRQIRGGRWFNSDGEDQRKPITDTLKRPINQFPHYAERTSLLMHNQAVPDDTDYVPDDNLMSNSKAELTPYQLEYIGIEPNGQNKPPAPEENYRTNNWVAILGEKHTKLKEFHVWEVTNKSDRGLKYHPNNTTDKVKSYPCWSSSKGRALENGKVVRRLLITEVMGKRNPWLLAVKDLISNKRIFKVAKKRFSKSVSRMCYAKSILQDLASQ